MDKALQERLDQIVEDEVQRGYRVREVPDYIYVQIKAASTVSTAVKPFSRFRFLKLTPRRRRQIQEEVMRRYNNDLKNEGLLSTEELRKLTVARGEWSLAEEKDIETLTQSTNDQAVRLNAMGLEDREDWTKDLVDAAVKYMEQIETSDKHPDEKTYLKEIYIRWSNYLPSSQATYDKEYAAKQELEAYSPDKDLSKLLDTSPNLECSEVLMATDDLLAKVAQYLELVEARAKLQTLMEKRAKIFSNSIENRRDQVEEMARVYFCAERLSEDSKSLGELFASFDDMWDLPDAVIQWLIEEAVMFHQNIPDEMRGRLEELGFLAQVPKIGTKEPSEDLPETPKSKLDTPPAETVASSSAESTPTI